MIKLYFTGSAFTATTSKLSIVSQRVGLDAAFGALPTQNVW